MTCLPQTSRLQAVGIIENVQSTRRGSAVTGREQGSAENGLTRGIWRVILASSVGTMIEWYDFYIFGSLAIFLAPKFYPPGSQTFANIAYLATFAVGFVVRPFGALFFGHIGDLVGRKKTILRVNPKQANLVVAISLLLAGPFFTIFGALSDHIGRKWLMMAACLLALVTYLPIYHAMQRAAGNDVVALSSVDDPVTHAPKLTAQIRDQSGNLIPAPIATNPNIPVLLLLIFIQMIYGCMIYGPIAAYLVEAFPAKIRYTSVSLPYHIGNGVFGGMVPLVGVYLCKATHNIYAGLYYPMLISGITLVVGTFSLKETHGVRIWDEYHAAPDPGRSPDAASD